MKTKLLILAAACLAAVSCKPEEPEQKPSLEVSPLDLTFEAKEAAPQTVTVEAVNVEWKYTLAGDASQWVTVTDNEDGTLTVSVNDNPDTQQRTASLNIEVTDGSKVKGKGVTIIQAGAETPAVYEISVDKTDLTFEATAAKAQEVKVTTEGEGLTWSIEMEEADKTWVTVTEGEGKFTVEVADNPEEKDRTAVLIVKPNIDKAEEKIVRVKQVALVIPPSMEISLSNGATPEEGFVFNYAGERLDNQPDYQIIIDAVHIEEEEWDATVEYPEGEQHDWVNLLINKFDNNNLVTVALKDKQIYESKDPRTATIIISSSVEGIGPFRVNVTQQGKPDFLSDILENVEMKPMIGYDLILNTDNDTRNWGYSTWELKLWSEGVEFKASTAQFSGTGERISIKFASESIFKNDEGVYYIPDGTYNVVLNYDDNPEVIAPLTVSTGKRALWGHPKSTNGTWFLRMDANNYVGQACISAGSMTVERTGETYKLTFNFESDAQFDVTGTYEGELTPTSVL